MKITYMLRWCFLLSGLLMPFLGRTQLNFGWAPQTPQPGQSVTFTHTSVGYAPGTVFTWSVDSVYVPETSEQTFYSVGQGTSATMSAPRSGHFRVRLSAGNQTLVKWIQVGGDLGVPKSGFGEQTCNMVKNYSFEDYSKAPTGLHQITNAYNWYDARNNYATLQTPPPTDYAYPSAGTADFFHRDVSTFPPLSVLVDVPLNGFGTQEPSAYYAAGHGYAGILTAVYKQTQDDIIYRDYKEYLIQKLDSPMRGGKSYTVKFFVSLAEGAKLGTSIGALFTGEEPGRFGNALLSSNLSQFTPYTPQITSGGVVLQTAGWQLVTGVVTVPVGQTYRYITIGNFTNGAGTAYAVNPNYSPLYRLSDDSVKIRTNQLAPFPSAKLKSYSSAYYYVDEVTVLRADCCPAEVVIGDSVNAKTYTSGITLQPGKTVTINGEFIVNTPVFTFNNNPVKMTAGSKITVNAGSKLQVVQGSVLEACSEMWEGIFCNGELFMQGGTVRDAKSALNFVPSSKWLILTSVLENNYRHMYVNGGTAYPSYTSSYMYDNILRCNPAQMKAPYAGYYTRHAIELVNVRTINIGTTGPVADRNEIRDANRGISARNVYTLGVYNNHFENIKCQPQGMACGIGTDFNVAIYAEGDVNAAAATYLKVGVSGNISARNTFNRCTGGIYTRNNMKVEAHGNILTNIRDYGMYSLNNNLAGNSVVYMQNTIKHAKAGIYVYNFGNSTVWAVGNTISKESDYKSAPTYGVRLENPLLSTAQYKVAVSGNVITRYRWGISVRQVNLPQMLGNTVNTHATLTDYPEGILVDHCPKAYTSGNSIYEQTAGGQSIGIRVEYSTMAGTMCNNTHANHIGLFFGGDQPASTVAANYLHNGRRGIYINWGEIGPQSTGKIPNLNAWIGDTWNSHFFTYGNNGVVGVGIGSPFNVKYPGSIFHPSPIIKISAAGGALISTPIVVSGDPNPAYVTNCRDINADLEGKAGNMERLLADTAMTADSALYGNEMEWSRKMTLYRAVAEDTTGQLAAKFYQYGEVLENDNIGKLDAARNSALDGKPTDAEIKLAVVTPRPGMEEKIKQVYGVAFKKMAQTETDWEFTLDELALLKDMAIECPYQYGEAVYTARTLLYAIMPDAIFMNTCEGVEWGNEKSAGWEPGTTAKPLASVYPNPSTDDFVVLFDSIAEAEQAEVIVTDLQGRVRGTYTLFRGANMVLIPGAGLEKGIYVCTIKVNGEIKETLKLEKL